VGLLKVPDEFSLSHDGFMTQYTPSLYYLSHMK
jgi:hypothetical protein